jgi:hypothetical protein
VPPVKTKNERSNTVNKKRLLIALAVVAVMLVGGITAGTALQINQPASAMITIEGIGNSPSFNLIDNDSNTTAGGNAGYIAGDDTYVIDLPGANIVLPRNPGKVNPGVLVGYSPNSGEGAGDPIFTIENKYAKNLIVSLGVVNPADANAIPVVGGGYQINLNSATPTSTWQRAELTFWPRGGFYQTVGAIAIPPGGSRTFDLRYVTWKQSTILQGHAQPEQDWTLALRLNAEENEQPLEVWAENNLAPNDWLYDADGEWVYHKLADGTVETKSAEEFAAWYETWPGE